MSDKEKPKASEQPEQDAAAPAEAAEPTEITVEFAQDYRGVLTSEQYYTKGTRVAFAPIVAQALVAAGRAVAVEA